MTRRPIGGTFARSRAVLGVLVLLPLFAVGCQNNKTSSLEQLQRENEELRDREAQLQAALSEAEARGMASEDERQRLQDELDRLRGEVSSSRSAATGFEGITGAQTSMRGSDIVVDVAGDVLFSSGSVTLRKDAKQTLDGIADVIKSRYSSNEIQIAGYTDSDPIRKSKWKTNERLSAERALAVEEYLKSRGVSGDQMHIAGYGSAKPRESKKSSRRVEIVVLGG